MSERDDVPFEKPVAEMSRTEILAVFEAYGFADAMGHRLTMCRHFSELVELAAGRGGVKED
uniref:Srine/threonine-protein phosphatase PP1-alpha catalytic subunit n=1 Tax=Myoviridae sp. ctpjm1 TaxID=2826699 RepID=A0A8S5NP08_9CAUD|nr:MAG TPA: srine/threonine-protein phosphatase PP1-alpha catalytic subunit [Myoviridae sp. ctpjm1]DAQ10789.1 MAG TPA: Serine/threonine-protein phosphatase [Caudoviricetes sp.]